MLSKYQLWVSQCLSVVFQSQGGCLSTLSTPLPLDTPLQVTIAKGPGYNSLLVPKLLFEQIKARSNNCFKQELTSHLIYFLSYLPTLLHSSGVPLNKKLIWRGLIIIIMSCTLSAQVWQFFFIIK